MSSAVVAALAMLIEAAGAAQISVPARLISGTITSADYPKGALARNAGGLTKVRLTISTDGRATDCFLFQSSGDAELDAMVCPLATNRMRFSPALAHDGKPVDMAAILPVRWEIDPAISPAPDSQK